MFDIKDYQCFLLYDPVFKYWITLQYLIKYHSLLGRGSRVLTATGFLYGNHWFSIPHEFDFPWPIAKACLCGLVG